MSEFSISSVDKLVYSNDLLDNIEYIKVDKKKHERKYNNDMRLLLSEILFITRYVDFAPNIKIIYIGAAPGFHLVKLMKLFPFIKFDLYDPEELNLDLVQYISVNSNQVTFFNEKFILETCEKYNNSEENIYLITDNRDVMFMKEDFNDKINFQIQKEISYAEDMNFQKEVCIKLNPKYAFLRFRPPHFYKETTIEPAIFEYFAGTVWLMIYNDYKSTEGRIAVNDFTKDNFRWNYKKYQFRLNFFNDKVRESSLTNPVTLDQTPLPNQLGNKFETVMMIQIIIDYMITIGYLNPRISELMNFYTNFLVVETCSDVPGLLAGCDIDVNTKNCDYNEEEIIYQDQFNNEELLENAKGVAESKE